MRISDKLVQISGPGEEILRNKLFDVNIELFYSNQAYRLTILAAISTLLDALNTDYKDYPKLKGISGANVGIPFNIIIVADDESEILMINPKIIECSTNKKVVKSNCGSIVLDKPIEAIRYKEVVVSYYELIESKKYRLERKIKRYKGVIGSTIQHEIDHNKGILITDRTKTEEKK